METTIVITGVIYWVLGVSMNYSQHFQLHMGSYEGTY